MKTIITSILISFITLSANAQEKLKIDTSKSSIHWYGYYLFYFGGHNGTIDFKEGHFIKTGDHITGGKFIIDMNSMTCLDIKKRDANEGLLNHLKEDEFFGVATYPKAILTIKKVKYHDATHMKIFADLTIKNVTHPIDFNAEVDFEKKQLTTKFKIDRMLWGVSYNSKMRNGAISDAIGFEVQINL